MSHHFDSAADRADGRINLCDLYVFPGAPGTTALILTVNPDAGRSSHTTFRPDAALGGTRLSVWARISVLDHVPPRQVNRIGQAMFRPLFFSAPDSEAEMDALNAGSPDPDRDTYSERVRAIAGTIARVAEAFLPDVVTYRPGQPAAFRPGEATGRSPSWLRSTVIRPLRQGAQGTLRSRAEDDGDGSLPARLSPREGGHGRARP